MNVLALDLALGKTGFATQSGSGVFSPPSSHNRGVQRLQWIRDRVMQFVFQGAIDLVVIEGYAYARANQAHQIGELGGVVRLELTEQRMPWIEIPPSTLKKLATGKGNAVKELVLVEAVKRLGYDGCDNNTSDALWLLQAALQGYGLPGAVELPKTHLAALDKVKWPEIADRLSHVP